MNAAEAIAPTLTEPLTWSEICQRYPEQWVCVVESVWDEPRGYHFRNARVVGYGATRRDALAQARRWWEQYKEIGHYFTGKLVAPSPRFFA